MTIQARLSDSVMSIPNTHYMTILGILLFLVAIGVQSLTMGVEAALIASTGVFFVFLGLLSFGIFWLLGRLDSV